MDKIAQLAQIAGLIRAKRRQSKIGLRTAALESEISASTLSRIERGAATTLPDAETLAKLSKWLKVPVSRLMSDGSTSTNRKSPKLATPEQIEVYLRADKNLSQKTAEALSQMFKLLYNQMTTEQSKNKSPTGG